MWKYKICDCSTDVQTGESTANTQFSTNAWTHPAFGDIYVHYCSFGKWPTAAVWRLQHQTHPEMSGCAVLDDWLSLTGVTKWWIQRWWVEHWSRRRSLVSLLQIHQWEPRPNKRVYLSRRGGRGRLDGLDWLTRSRLPHVCVASTWARWNIESPICISALPFHYRSHNDFLIWLRDADTNNAMG